MLILENEKLTASKYDNAIILPSVTDGRLGGVVNEDGEYISDSAFAYDSLTLWGGGYGVDEPIRYIDEDVIYIGFLQKHWGNFLFDNLNRLWYVVKQCESRENIRVVYCGFDIHDSILKDSRYNYMDVFRAAGLEEHQIIEAVEPVRYRSVTVPQMSHFPGTYYSREMIDVYDSMREYAESLYGCSKEKASGNSEESKAIYLTRTGMAARKETGEEEIERIFRKNGYEIVSPERISQAELIYKINHCSKLAAIEGTITHNVVFMNNPDVDITILRKLDYKNTRQLLFNESRGYRPTYVDVFMEPYRGFPRNHDDGPYWIGMTSNLRHDIRNKGMKISIADMLVTMLLRVRGWMLYTARCLYSRMVNR